MSKLDQHVREQILREAPQMESAEERETYVYIELATMTNAELLQRISDALDELRP